MSEKEMDLADRATESEDSLAADLQEDSEMNESGGHDASADNEVDRLGAELLQVTDQLKRQAAEFQNYRRRTEQEKAQSVALGKSLVISSLLDIVDDFERSLEATHKAEEEVEGELSATYVSLKSGVDLIYQKLQSELTRLGVEAIEAEGQPFDEDVHEAMLQQPAAEGQESGIVLTEIQRGYRMGDRVLRHARVIVSS